jgi:hypothetical protein
MEVNGIDNDCVKIVLGSNDKNRTRLTAFLSNFAIATNARFANLLRRKSDLVSIIKKKQ